MIMQIVILQNAYGLYDKTHCFVASIVISSLLCVGSLGYFFVKEKLLRKAQEKQVAESKESLIM